MGLTRKLPGYRGDNDGLWGETTTGALYSGETPLVYSVRVERVKEEVWTVVGKEVLGIKRNNLLS